MTERNELLRDAFQADPLGPRDRDRLWLAMQYRQTRQARLRYLVRAGALLLASAIIAAVVFPRLGVRSTTGPGVVAADSLTINFPSEQSMIQENRDEAPLNLIPLLGHRSSLRMEIVTAEQRRDELIQRLNQTAGREHDAVARELAAIEEQLESSRLAIRIIDQQLSGHEAVVTHTETLTGEAPQIFQIDRPISDEVMWMAGGAGGVLLLAMLSLLVYMRHIARSTREALSLVAGQVASQHATLASGIDAIALEVERLGEGQRFMSKALAGSDVKVRQHD
jgi:hypothetical protein